MPTPATLSAAATDAEKLATITSLMVALLVVTLLLLIVLVMTTLLWRRAGKRGRRVERDLAGLRSKVDGLEDLWAEAGARYGTGASTATRPRGGDAPRPGGRSLDAGDAVEDDPPPPGF